MEGFGGLGMMFQVVPILMAVVFILVIGLLIRAVVSSARQRSYNNAQPVLSVAAVVAAKRADVHMHHHMAGETMHHTTSSTSYHVTFEVESGDRLEFQLPSRAYGVILEGDRGKLTFQGTRFLEFQRLQEEET